MMTGRLALAVDVGATKVAAGLVDVTGKVRERVQEPLTRQGGQAAVRQVVGLARRVAADKATAGVCVAVPAVVDPDHREVVWAPNIRGWRRVRLADAVEEVLHVPTSLAYDGHAAVLGEHWIGAGKSVRNLVMLVVGTGIGGGMILDGHLHSGSDGLAGAAGWLTSGACAAAVRADDHHQPTLEVAAAGPGLARRAGATDGRAEAIFAAAASGDARSQRALDDVAGRLGLAVADVVSLLNPDLVVLGGGVCSGAAGARLLPRIRRAVRDHAQPAAARRVRIVLSRLGINAALVGAARAVFAAMETEGRL
jgi:glucokinase